MVVLPQPARYRDALLVLGLLTLLVLGSMGQVGPPLSTPRYSREGFFLYGSSYTVTSKTLELRPRTKVGFSFRTCTPGELLSQTGDSLDQLKVRLDEAGRVHFVLSNADQTVNKLAGAGFLDGLWHTVLIEVGASQEDISLTVTSPNQFEVRAEADRGELGNMLTSMNLNASTPQLRVGAGMVACIREGPNVRFTDPDLSINSFGVNWDRCLLPFTCQGHDWSHLTLDSPSTSPVCPPNHCHNGGLCLPAISTSAPGCLCPPFFSGPNCGQPVNPATIDSCEENPCQGGGMCSIVTGEVRCNCAGTGRSGHFCQMETNPCTTSSPCQNDGTCFHLPSGGYVCECTNGYIGSDCETSVLPLLASRSLTTSSSNPCVSGFCLNGGECFYQSVEDMALCDCAEGFSGSRCEITPCDALECTEHSECVSNAGGQYRCQCVQGFSGDPPTSPCVAFQDCTTVPCANGGVCTNQTGNGLFQCSCPSGFGGQVCQTVVDDCLASNPCQNGATCRNLLEPQSVACDCAQGFTGDFCSQDINECGETPCSHGTCQNYPGGFKCNCEAGWTGPVCDVNINECSSNPCLNGATCRDQSNGFLCVCPAGYTGAACESDIDECLSAPCQNGGSCSDGVGNFTCECAPAFMGATCDLPYDPCAENSCQNGAPCKKTKDFRDPGNDFYCECPEGFEGLRCENNIDECAEAQCPPFKVCVDLVARYECQCPQGFAGENCTQEIDDCLSSPCANNGSCVDLKDGFLCNCSEGWTGSTCSEDIDECSENDTLCNNGICRNTAGSFECYCRPGFSGNRCNHDFDECLSRPCQNGGNCTNKINDYECVCPAGFAGPNCEINIDECESNPCLNGGTCTDGINDFTCACLAGFTGLGCEINIDECEGAPCLNGGLCVDGIDAYNCVCNGTGFEGLHCEFNIDECLPQPCQNNATCTDEINDYTCDCFQGFGGKNCDIDIAECMDRPCENGAICFERSNLTLYRPEVMAELPLDVRDIFNQSFSYFDASGFVCSCLPGYEGPNCEIDINECADSPCLHGECQDGIAQYFCVCDDGYEGQNCEFEIDECDRYQPCQHGSCTDRIADFICNCEPGWGGKNCSVALTGCEDVVCLNGGTCTPWLIGENDHRANCSCTSGFDGLRCQSRTTFSLNGKSYIKVPSDRSEGYELHMKFRTTLGNGLVAIGQGNTHFSLQLRQGKLNLHSNLISKFEGIIIGEHLNNTEWQKVYVAVNSSHLTLGVNDRLQATQPINPTGENDTVFFNTFLGGIVRDQQILANNVPSFTGCIQDIVVNDMKITEEDFKDGVGRDVEQINTTPGCPRVPQCDPNPCQNEGYCTDLWSEYKCSCHRPFLGPSCQHNYTAATFGFENTTDSIAIVNVDNPRIYRSVVDISMFIQTREEEGFIFYIGSEINSATPSYITGRLSDGNLVVHVYFDTNPERFQVYTVNLSDGYRHFIRVVRMNNSLMVKVNETVSINHEIPSIREFVARRVYLGNLPTSEPPTPRPTTRMPPSTTTEVPAQFVSVTQVDTTPEPATTLGPEMSTDMSEDDEDAQMTTQTPLEMTTLLLGESLETPKTVSSTTYSEATQQSPTTNIEENLTEEFGYESDIPSAAPVLSQRLRRQVTMAPALVNDLSPLHFKGVIQDVQISDGGNLTRIIELFKLQLDEKVDHPKSIGRVSLSNVEKGVVSDNTCSVDPCQNGGTCQVTWNDYVCNCTPGFMGRNCEKMEYCYWFSCPGSSQCMSLDDGHECVSNATFNGANTTLTYSSVFNLTLEDAALLEELPNEVTAVFRTKYDGTLLHILGVNEMLNRNIRIGVAGERLEIEIPEQASEARTDLFGYGVNDGNWHKVKLEFAGDGIVMAYLDETQRMRISLDSYLNMSTYLREAEVIVGSGRSSPRATTRDQYAVGTNDEDYPIDVRVNSLLDSNEESFFRGCMGEIRVGGLLLPFFTDQEMVNVTTRRRFSVEVAENLDENCTLCYQDECRNGGTCSDPEEIFECSCPVGFEDSWCFTNIDECAQNGCLNGACIDGVANYTCSCNPGWTGWLCDVDFDECTNEPCQNGGVCSQTILPGNYTCECSDEYIGKNCEELKIKTCEQQPCQNGGTCRPGASYYSGSNNQYTCDCNPGFKGEDCERKKDFCEEFHQPCVNGATCLSLHSTLNYKCNCMPGFAGDTCEEDINECEAEPCQNGGKCTNLVNAFQCDCNATGFTGKTCSQNINECLENPCVYGDCQDTLGAYECRCNPGYCGINCQRSNPCLGSDEMCMNGGICVPACDVEPFHTCNCTENWTGLNCTDKIPRPSATNLGDARQLIYIAAPLIGIFLFFSLIALLVFASMAKKKRSLYGTYSPQKQEFNAPRLELQDLKLKLPPEERLI